ncbi:Regulator of nucleoside diphosphate kinase [Hyphomicrobium sulfonivorans]|uniref:Regulator of nucleoside diphosphate kinase n=1 Tax=Hyphomicrobium sulfonivorans TaxID=121290 RepID=A0A125NU46_HYPSL|nr:nucleoside diphosphate kinase regulator [Hyphomicrobium sulfonivorans]KWT65518.1 Regulator of nucleoside diphosphate kinase [Hyphomicrobium sulfonivorans]
MADVSNPQNKPAIMVSDVDYKRLSDLAVGALERMPAVAEVLLAEMDRAEVVAASTIPANVVQMQSTVNYRSDAGEERRVTLVYPAEADIAQGRISIMTPIGSALIGLSTGQSIAWTTRDGQRHELTVVSVEQPSTLLAG